MAREEKKRIDTNAAASARPGLNAAFAGLEVSNLPSGPEARPSAPVGADSPQKVWKMGRVVLRRELARRGGKTVIVVHDFATHLPVSVIETVAKTIRTSCGCGGTVKGRTIEVQGDQPARVRTVLEAEGFEVAGVK
jgi:translation initiation factor 1